MVTMSNLLAGAILLHACFSALSPAVAFPLVSENADRPSRYGGQDGRNHSHILIIGAGVAGVATAARLMENGFYNVTVLEAEKRIGGRVHTVAFGEDIVDLGAEWVHGEVGNVVYEMAEPLGLLNHNSRHLDSAMEFVWSGGAIADREDVSMLLNISKSIRGRIKDDLSNYNGSYGQWFLDQFAERLLVANRRPHPNLVDRFLNWFEKATSFYDGSDTWYNTSGRGLVEYHECPGDLAISWKRGGYRNVIDLLTKRIPDSKQEIPVRRRVLRQHEVRSIRWGEAAYGPQNTVPAVPEVDEVPAGGVGSGEREGSTLPRRPPVVVECTNGARFTAGMVVVTVSLGVLKQYSTQLFDPPLYQRKINAIQNIGFGQVDKLFMYFSDPWWPSNLTGYSVLVTEEDLETFKRMYPQYGAKGHWVHGLSGFYIDQHKPHVVLMDWIVGEPARTMEQYSDYQIMVGCKRWLEMFVGANFSVPLPDAFTRSKWWSNQHFRGSYSYRSLDSDRADAWAAQLAEPILDEEGKPVVMFAGEATHDHFYSTVHGAIETGWREADRILDALQMENRSRKLSKRQATLR